MAIKPMVIRKQLSANDIGKTGSHQAGILVPKKSEALGFFPELSHYEKNPRVHMLFYDVNNICWKLNFIYYNNKYFDEKGTRDEYRLTGLTAFFRENNLKENDYLILKHVDDEYYIDYTRADNTYFVEDEDSKKVKLKLSCTWTVISTK